MLPTSASRDSTAPTTAGTSAAVSLRQLLRVVIPLTALWCLLPLPCRSADIYLPPQLRLPEEIYTFSGGSVTRRDLLDAVLQAAQPAAGEVPKIIQTQPAGFLEFLLIDMLARNLKPAEIDKEVGKRLGELAARAGGDAALDTNLRQYARPAVTRADLYRRIRQNVLAEKSGYTTLSADQLEQRFHPRWYGMGSRIVASAAGSDFTRDDLAHYLLLQAGDGELANLLQERIERQILLAEAGKMGLNTQGMETGQALQAIFAPLVTEDALREYFDLKRAEFLVYKVREFPFSGELRAGQPPQTNAHDSNAETVRKQAEELAAKLQGGSDLTPLLSTGVLNYYYAMDLQPAQVPPTVYGLDYIYTPGAAAENPLRPADEPLREVLRQAKPGTVAGIVARPAAGGQEATPAGTRYDVIYCEEVLTPRLPQRLYPGLAALRLNEQRLRLIRALTAPGAGAAHWQPAERIERNRLYPPVPALARDAAPEGITTDELLLPELKETRSAPVLPARAPSPRPSEAGERRAGGPLQDAAQPLLPVPPVMPELPEGRTRETPASTR